ncbi:Peptidase family M48 [Chitinophaga jiangningensis]|uniref:Peptidase family M48 n=1 Tax=Chitinophaga jiangningensis TaxID=1419482 RepID=A0A1M7IZZ6_9BACT|nr:M48 family metallopeptidase [Chitinophaga jiangningensis]SHM46390.1 Peptidase family M48 [Chitinophaga jiangningensis]
MYSGNYFDNKTAALTPADIRLNTESLEFHVGSSRFYWLYREINVQLINKKSLRITHPVEGGLEIKDPVCIETFTKLYYAGRGPSLHRWVLRSGNKAALLIAAVLFISGLACYFLLLPFLAEQAVKRIPLSFDRELGKMAQSSLNEEPNTKGSQLLTEFARHINWQTADTITFAVVASETENAYALPGGYIVVYDGLLRKLNTKEELAALLAHEVSHIRFRHSTRKLCKQLGASLVLDVFFGGMGASSVLLSNADALHSLSYSRQFEKEADLEGLALLQANKIDQLGMVQLMQVLSAIPHKLKIPDFLSTHPLTKERIYYVRDQIRKHPAAHETNNDLEKAFRQLKALYPS